MIKKGLWTLAATLWLSTSFAEAPIADLAAGFLKGEQSKIKIELQKPQAKVSCQQGVLTAQMTAENTQLYLTSPGIKLSDDKKYLLSFEVKIDQLKRFDSKSYVLFYIYNRNNNAHNWFGVQGSGSAAWTTVLLPFSGKNLLKGKPGTADIMLRFQGVSGTAQFKNFSVVELPANSDMKRGMVTAAGKTVSVDFLHLK